MTNKEIAEIIKKKKYRVFNKELAHLIGLNESIYLMYLIDCDRFLNKDNVGNPFFKQQKFIYLETTLKQDVVRKLNKKFIELGLIEIVKDGMPAKNYFVLSYKNIMSLIKKAEEEYEKLQEKTLKEKQQQFTENEGTGVLNLREENNNNIINNNSSINILSKDNNLLEVNSKELTYIGADNINNINNINNNIECNDNVIVSKMDSVESAPKKGPANPANEKPQRKGGLAPLFDMVDKKYDKVKYITLNIGLKTYLKAHIGCRRLPSIEKWQDMLDRLEQYSSIKLAGTVGSKFIESNAIQIVEKAMNLKGDAPYPDFDNIFNVILEKNNIELSNMKGY